MGEAGVAARSASQIELPSILALGNADPRWRAQAVWVQKCNNRFLNLFCNACARDARGVVKPVTLTTAKFNRLLAYVRFSN